MYAQKEVARKSRNGMLMREKEEEEEERGPCHALVNRIT